MRTARKRYPPLVYLIVGLLLGGGTGLILFRGFPTRGGVYVQPDAQPSRSSGGAAELEVQPGASFGANVGEQAPDFTLTALDGSEYRLSDFRGQVVMLNFWATWCGPCLIEMPLIDARYQAYREDGLVVLAVNDGESRDQVQAFSEDNSLTFPLLLDPGSVIQRKYQIRGYPSSVFIDRQGEIEFVHIGLVQETQLQGYLAALGFGT